MENIKEYFKIAVRNLRTRSLRSWLTILGIVIGVFLIITLLSLSEGLKSTINQQLRSLGGEMVIVMPGDISNPMGMFTSGAKLEKEDIEAIKKVEEVESVLTMSYQSSVVRYGEESKSILVDGMPLTEGQDILENFQGWSLSSGEWPTPGKKEILIGSQVKTEVFDKPVRVGSELVIKGKKFEVSGILNSLGSKQDDASIYMDLVAYQDLTGEKKGTALMAMVKAEDGSNIDRVAAKIKESLQETRKRRVGTDAADFSVITSEKMGEIAGSILGVIQMVIIMFASIAIVVGGIGITNTMFTSVRERTREIGIMKAIGADNKSILVIFLVEASIIGMIGGVGGTVLGTLASKAVEVYGQVHPMFYFKADVSLGLVIFGLTFSFLVGSIAGLFPASQAAKLKPVDALRRYE